MTAVKYCFKICRLCHTAHVWRTADSLQCSEFDLLEEADRLTQLEATWSSAFNYLLWQHAACLWQVCLVYEHYLV